MPLDDAGLGAPWLDPMLIRSLANRVATAQLNGAHPAGVERACHDLARVLRPAWLEQWIAEVAGIALWVGDAD